MVGEARFEVGRRRETRVSAATTGEVSAKVAEKKKKKERMRSDPTKKWVLGGEIGKERVLGACRRVEKRFLRDAIGEESETNRGKMGFFVLCMEDAALVVLLRLKDERRLKPWRWWDSAREF